MAHYERNEAEEIADGQTWVNGNLKPGDTVRVSEEFVATITHEGLDCDCGKGVLCPLHPQSRVHYTSWVPYRYHTLDPIDHYCHTCGDFPATESRLDHLTRTAYQPAVDFV